MVCTIPLGIWLSVQFGMVGLAAHSILCLIIGYNCPDTVLFQKPPDDVNRHTGKQYYKGVSSGVLISFIALIGMPITVGIIIWTVSLQDFVVFISRFSRTEIVNDNMLMTTNYLAFGSADGFEISDKTYEKLDNMRKYFPRFCLYAVVSRLIIYIWLPILIAISVFDHSRISRNDYDFRRFRQKPAVSHLKQLAGISIVFPFIYWLDYVCASPFILADLKRGQFGLIIGPSALVMLWMGLLLAASQIISKPQTWSMEHPWDHGPFPVAKFDISIMPHERGWR